MTHLCCSNCGQRFHTSATRRFPSCAVCGGRLEASMAPAGRSPARGGAVLPTEPPPVVRAEAGSYVQGENSYASLTEFARARRERLTSTERDFGLRWSDEGGRLFRAAWVAETGELYLVQLGPPEDGGGHVEVVAAGTHLWQVEQTLRGWREAITASPSLPWLRERAAHLGAGPLALAG